MKSRGLLATGLVLLIVGIVGMVSLPYVGGWLAGYADYQTLGERIYYTGYGENGQIPRSMPGGRVRGAEMMTGAACVNCHQEDGRGGRFTMMMGWSVEVPDIRYSTLTKGHEEGGETEPGWTDSEIADAIRNGVEPNGQQLRAPMPRWDMSDTEVEAVIDYLRELSQ